MELLAGAGFCARQSATAITSESLKEARIFVVSNPGGWGGPDASLSVNEVSAVITWVQAGGSLLLILDHSPAPKNAAMLTTALGVPAWHDGYALVKVSDRLVPNIIFWQPGDFPTDAPAVVSIGAALIAAIIVYRHRANLTRLIAGTERRIGQRLASK